MLETALDQSPELRRHLLKQEDAKAKRQWLYGVLEKISVCKRDWDQFQQISAGNWPSDREAQAFREYQDHLASQGVIDFDDILLLALRILTDRPAVASIYQRTYHYLCVDEGQDLNAVQYALIRTLGAQSKSLLMVGDPNQAIYGFNGSSHRFMMEELPRDFAVETIELRLNYRSSKAVIRAANAIYPKSNEVDHAALDGELQIVGFPDEDEPAFENTYRLIEALPFSNLHVFAYSRREGTPAAALPDPVPETVKAARVRALIELGERKRAAFAQRFIGRPVTMLIERVDAQGRGHGWTSEYVEAVAACAPDARKQLITFTVRSCADAVLRDG